MGSGLILTLDGSTGTCAVALLSPAELPGRSCCWEVGAARSGGDARAQVTALLPMIDEMLLELGRGPESLGAIVVGNGPGTFTGVRITVATARALALSLGIAVVGITTPAGLAAGAARMRPDADLLVPIVDARRGQVFYCVYARTMKAGCAPGTLWERITPIGVSDRDELANRVGAVAGGARNGVAGRRRSEASVLVIGGPDLRPAELVPAGMAVELEMRSELLVLGQELLHEPGSLPAGDRLQPWLRQVLENPRTGSGSPLGPATHGPLGAPESVKPIYVRAPDAEAHIAKMRDPFADGGAQGAHET